MYVVQTFENGAWLNAYRNIPTRIRALELQQELEYNMGYAARIIVR